MTLRPPVRVLVAPSARHFCPDVGSEDGWVVDVIRHCTTLYDDVEFVCLGDRVGSFDESRITTIALGRSGTENATSFFRPFRVANQARKQDLLRSATVMHHALPFTLGRTYSLLAWRARSKGIPVIFGPVQPQSDWSSVDEKLDALEQQATRKSAELVSQVAESLIWNTIYPVVRGASYASLRAANRVVATGSRSRDLLEQIGIDSGRITIIPPPVTYPDILLPEKSRSSCELRLVTAGWLIERKAIKDIIIALTHLGKRGVHMSLSIVGDGPQRAALEKLVIDSGLSQNVKFTGWLSRKEVGLIMSESDVYVTMSHFESYGQAVAEAMAFGLPVISADNTGALELIQGGKNGWLIPKGDIRSLAELLESLATNRDKVISVGKQARSWIRESRGTDVIARKWMELYRSFK